VQTIAAEWIERTQQAEPEPKTNQVPRQIGICTTCDYWKPLDLFAGDIATLRPATDLQPRRIVAMYRHAGALDNYDFDAGRFLRFESDQEFEGLEGKHPAIVIETPDGDESVFDLNMWTACHLTATPHLNAQSEQIATLRGKLDRLGDDITDSTQRFKIEREIYDLEHEADTDEWADIINAQAADQ
jgi:hypothetical protein